jgi:light-regulated signal transduction histidine kinase (bacteriophytochrome)
MQRDETKKGLLELDFVNSDLRQAQDAVLKLNQDLELKVIARTVELETVNKELASFSYSVSHDLRAPIRAISGYTKVLEEDYADKIDDEGKKSLQAIINNTKRMGMLIDDLLAISRLGRKQVTYFEINMDSQVSSIKEEVLREDHENRINFVVKDLFPAKGDQALVKQVWINLISNSVKYSKNEPLAYIEVGAFEKEKDFVYYVKDNGAGFDMLYYEKLFGVFQRLHSQEEFEGTGIGLAIVQKIIHRHNGTVWAESKLNEGACFYFSMPNIDS